MQHLLTLSSFSTPQPGIDHGRVDGSSGKVSIFALEHESLVRF